MKDETEFEPPARAAPSARVRVATEADATAIQAIYAPIVLDTAISFEEVPPTVQEMTDRIRGTLSTYPFLVFENDGDIAGYAYGSAHRARAAYRWSVDVSVYVRTDARRSGIGRELYQALLETLTRQRFHAAFAGIALPNPGSVGLHEALGFVHLGTYAEVGFKHASWHDVGWWRRPLASNQAPSEPIPFPQLTPPWSGPRTSR